MGVILQASATESHGIRHARVGPDLGVELPERPHVGRRLIRGVVHIDVPMQVSGSLVDVQVEGVPIALGGVVREGRDALRRP